MEKPPYVSLFNLTNLLYTKTHSLLWERYGKELGNIGDPFFDMRDQQSLLQNQTW